MKKLLVACLFALGVNVCVSDFAAAQQPGLYPFVPFGFYQPYGARIGSSLPTPPYFALNPPVYYGARHARPYGMSPFAAPPMVSAPSTYHGRLRSRFVQPVRPLPAAAPAPCCNPHVSQGKKAKINPDDLVVNTPEMGPVRGNPFVADVQEKLASK